MNVVLNFLKTVKKKAIEKKIVLKHQIGIKIDRFKYLLIKGKKQVLLFKRKIIDFTREYEFRPKLKTLSLLLFNIAFTGHLIHFVYPIANPYRIGVCVALIEHYFTWTLKKLREK